MSSPVPVLSEDELARRLIEPSHYKAYLRTLPPSVRNATYALQALQEQCDVQFRARDREIDALEKEFDSLCASLLTHRAALISGELTPTDAEVDKGFPEEHKGLIEMQSETDPSSSSLKSKTDPAPPPSALPGFWLQAMKGESAVAETITERDENILKHLSHVECKRNPEAPRSGFTLFFHFSSEARKYFTQPVLSKSFVTNYEAEECIFLGSQGCEISWVSESVNVTLEAVRKKQRSKKTSATRYVTTYEPCESFFALFEVNHPVDPNLTPEGKMPKIREEKEKEGSGTESSEGGSESSGPDMITLALLRERDFELGRSFQSDLFFRAVEYYTREVESDSEDEEDYDFDEEDFDLSDDDEESSEEDSGKDSTSEDDSEGSTGSDMDSDGANEMSVPGIREGSKSGKGKGSNKANEDCKTQ